MVFLGHLEDMHHVLDLPQSLILVGYCRKKKSPGRLCPTITRENWS